MSLNCTLGQIFFAKILHCKALLGTFLKLFFDNLYNCHNVKILDIKAS